MPELLVSLAVMGIAMGAVGQMFLASLRTASAAAHRTDATALAERDIEAMRAIPYDQLGYNDSQAGFSSTFVDGATVYSTVQVNDPFQPQMSPTPVTVVLGGVSYTVTRAIYWVGADRSDPARFPEGYKQTTVFVNWSDPTGTHTVRQEGIIYPGGQGAYKGRQGGGATTTTTALAGAPSAPTLTGALDVRNPSTTINLSWTAGADHYQVQYSADDFLTANTLASGVTANTYQVTGRAPLSIYQFRVGAFAADGSGPVWSNTFTLITANGARGAACAVTSVSVTPTPLRRAIGLQSLLGDVTVSVITTGPCVFISARYTPSTVPMTVFLTPNAGSTHWTGTLDGMNTNWVLGNHRVAIWDELLTTSLNSTGGVTVTS